MNKSKFFYLWVSLITINYSLLGQEIDRTNNKSVLWDLIGTWSTKGISRNTDGNWKTDTTTATWIWYKILNDKAIQDDWYAGTTPDKLDEAKSMGTNIRIYNEAENKWYMGWIDTFNYKLLTFTATEENRELTMEGQNAQGRPIRNVFRNVNAESFDWVQQWSFDEGKTWIDVAKIWGNRWIE